MHRSTRRAAAVAALCGGLLIWAWIIGSTAVSAAVRSAPSTAHRLAAQPRQSAAAHQSSRALAAAQAVTPTMTLPITATGTLTSTGPPPTPAPLSRREIALRSGNALDLADLGSRTAWPTGALITNRTRLVATFFLDGQTHLLPPSESVGVALPEPATVMTLFSCRADQDSSAPQRDGCQWDPYLVHQTGYFELVTGSGPDRPETLLLQEVIPPGPNQFRLHNRSGLTEPLYYAGTAYSLAPGALLELTQQGDAPDLLYLRRCLVMAADSICEWLPQPVTGGAAYGLSLEQRAGSQAEQELVQVVLTAKTSTGAELLVTTERGGDAAAGTTGIARTSRITCRLNVATLNVRSGPGSAYLILTKLRQEELGDKSVGISGRSDDGDWLAVDESIQAGGWIAGAERFVTCSGPFDGLPLVPVVDGRLEPVTAAPVTAPAAGVTPTPEAPAASASGPPPNRAQLVIINTFDREMIFTLQEAYSLRPGERISLEIEPGRVTFSASSPWNGLSGNAEFMIEAEQTRELYIRFLPTETEGEWKLSY